MPPFPSIFFQQIIHRTYKWFENALLRHLMLWNLRHTAILSLKNEIKKIGNFELERKY